MRIEINLLPRQKKSMVFFLNLCRNYFSYLTLALLIIVVMNILLFAGIKLTSVSYKKLTLDLKKLSSSTTNIKNDKAVLDKLLKAKQWYNTFDENNIYASKLLANLFSSLPKDIWFKVIYFNENYLKISGSIVPGNEDYLLSANNFIGSLNKNNYFSHHFKTIKLKKTYPTQIAGVEVMDFVIECR